ncbi:MAG TPA: antitoxin MazE family protein [Vicinamibacterales bacterium]|nr:antitoxin MazE family protein [Vicinamibacterales bacterium]
MPTARRAKSSRDKVRAHRARLRKQGLRPIQIWLPDVNAPEFIRLARKQSLAIARSEQEAEDQAFVDAITQWPPDDHDVETR